MRTQTKPIEINSNRSAYNNQEVIAKNDLSLGALGAVMLEHYETTNS